MRDQIAALAMLQQLDLELKVIEEKLEKYPQEMNRIISELDNAKRSIIEAKKEIEQLGTNKKEIEEKSELNRSTIKKSEKRLFEIKTYREYEALQKEISETKSVNASLEEQILQVMELFENTEQFINDKEAELTEKEVECERLVTDYKSKISELEKIHEVKRRDKEKIVSLIKPEIIPVYEKIKARNGIAIAPARNEVCTGCNMNIPPQLFNEVLRLTQVIQCPNCRRILYCEESVNGEQIQTA
ncbi:MAG: zinc ribbon domain-containing protein [Thermodesulfobacteriota bacterium]